MPRTAWSQVSAPPALCDAPLTACIPPPSPTRARSIALAWDLAVPGMQGLRDCISICSICSDTFCMGLRSHVGIMYALRRPHTGGAPGTAQA